MSKNVETEIKYKVDHLPSELPIAYQFRQIYFGGLKKIDLLKTIFPNLDYSIITTYRVREIHYDSTQYVLTLKTKAIGYSRGEFEIEITKDTFEDLIQNNIESEIVKNRYIIPINELIFEFDEYKNLAINLITCEIEVEEVNKQTLEKIENILINKFNVQFINVSDDKRYRNSNLIEYFGKK